MQLTRASDYAVRVMIYLAARPAQQRVRLPLLARATEAPESFLSKVLQALCRAGFIASPPGRKASVRAVIEAIEGPIYLNLCLASGASCKRKSYCPAHPIWVKAQEAMMGVLNTTTVAELAAEQAAPQPRLSGGRGKAAGGAA
jgi:Rrf2 family protein